MERRRKSFRKSRGMGSPYRGLGLAREHALDSQRQAAPGFLLRGQQLLAAPGDLVVFGLAVVFGDSPMGGDGAVEFQAVEGRIERAFLHLEGLGREQVDRWGNGIAVQGAALQDYSIPQTIHLLSDQALKVEE